MKLGTTSRHLLGAALAMVAISAPTTITKADTQSQQQTSQGNREMTPTNRRMVTQPNRVNSIGGHDIINIGGDGYSPKFYGENIVRKGTHKRSNK